MASKGSTAELIEELKRLDKAATPGPWCIESCGEKGDGANVIGVAFGPQDQNCEYPLSGWLQPFDADGHEIDYYRDEEVAVCEHRNRNAGKDATLIADLRTHLPSIIAALEAAERDRKALAEADAMIARLTDGEDVLDMDVYRARVRHKARTAPAAED